MEEFLSTHCMFFLKGPKKHNVVDLFKYVDENNTCNYNYNMVCCADLKKIYDNDIECVSN